MDCGSPHPATASRVPGSLSWCRRRTAEDVPPDLIEVAVLTVALGLEAEEIIEVGIVGCELLDAGVDDRGSSALILYSGGIRFMSSPSPTFTPRAWA